MQSQWATRSRSPPVAKLPEFQKKQFAFAAHIRDPEHNPAPGGVEDRRMAIYRELFFNNLHNLIGTTFPVIRTRTLRVGGTCPVRIRGNERRA
jgi:hypothetical protein